MSMPVTIIIPNFNGAHLLKRNLPSVIAAAGNYSGGASIIVVDDGSSDDSLQVLNQLFPAVRVVPHPRNRGFAEAVHSGVHAAETELLLLLNSDVQPHPECIKPLVEYFQDTSTFSVSPCVFDEDGNVDRHAWHVRQYQASGLKLIPWKLEDARAKRAASRLKTLYASGGSMLVRKSMFLELRGFSPIFKPFYSEDYDLGLRAWRRGWASYFEPYSTVVHQKQGSIKDNVRRNRVKRIRRRNKYLLEWIHTPLWRLWVMMIPMSLWRVLGEIVLLDKVNVAGFFSAIVQLPAVLRERSKLRKTDKYTLDEVVGMVKEN